MTIMSRRALSVMRRAAPPYGAPIAQKSFMSPARIVLAISVDLRLCLYVLETWVLFCVHEKLCQVRNVRKEVLPVTVFKRETGIMNIFFWCTAHPLHFKRIYDLCELSSDTGEVCDLFISNTSY
jgi:hypothetical protein